MAEGKFEFKCFAEELRTVEEDGQNETQRLYKSHSLEIEVDE